MLPDPAKIINAHVNKFIFVNIALHDTDVAPLKSAKFVAMSQFNTFELESIFVTEKIVSDRWPLRLINREHIYYT